MEEVCLDITKNANLTTFPDGKVMEDEDPPPHTHTKRVPRWMNFTPSVLWTNLGQMEEVCLDIKKKGKSNYFSCWEGYGRPLTKETPDA